MGLTRRCVRALYNSARTCFLSSTLLPSSTYPVRLHPPLSVSFSSSSDSPTSLTQSSFTSASCCSHYFTMPAKKRCQFQINTDAQCNSAALRIVGECPHCRAQFCGSVSPHLCPMPHVPAHDVSRFQHRLPEHHNCSKLEDCRQQAFDRNKSKLESERTVASKMATA